MFSAFRGGFFLNKKEVKIMKRILFSLITISAISALLVGATRAYFSDTETSTDNRFQAGAVDLKVGNANSTYNGLVTNLNFEPTDLTDEVFFDFRDVKPGDWGYDTISLRVDDNNAWMCADITVTKNGENGVMEPEEEAGDSEQNPQYGFWGELANYIHFYFWNDANNNGVKDAGEQMLTTGPASDLLAGYNPADDPEIVGFPKTTFALADANFSAFQSQGVSNGSPVLGSENYYVGKYWCFGDIVETDDGLTCVVNPLVNYNDAQTDRLYGNIEFRAVQHRNNAEFTCESV